MRHCRAWLWVLGLVCVPVSGAQAAPVRGGTTEITLERHPCFGFCPVDTVTLRADGSAVYEGKQHVPRIGRYPGSVSPRDFNRLSRFLQDQGFFQLKPRYAVPATDLPTIVTVVTRNGRQVRVENYGDAGPESLWLIERAILGVASTVAWNPEPERTGGDKGRNGIRGIAVIGPVHPVQRPGESNTRPYPDGIISVEPKGGGREIARAKTDAQGRFRIALPPGEYRLVPLPSDPDRALPRATPQDATVTAGRFAEIRIRYDSGIR